MMVTLVRSRLRPEFQDEYSISAQRMAALAVEMPGYVAHKGFLAPDGERLTVAVFDSETSLRAWAVHPEHVQAKRLGRDRFFSEYKVQICSLIRESSFPKAT